MTTAKFARTTRRSQSSWNAGSSGSTSTDPKPATPPRSCTPSITREFGAPDCTPWSAFGDAEHRDHTREQRERLPAVVGERRALHTRDVLLRADRPQRVPAPEVVQLFGEAPVELPVDLHPLGLVGLDAALVEQLVDDRV